MDKTINIGGAGESLAPETLLLRMGNRHGLIAGATGTGKTVTVQALAEQFSWAGVPVFLADAKSDLAGISQPGSMNRHIRDRLDILGIENFIFSGSPTSVWDVFGEEGIPVKVSIEKMGPLLFAKMLDLTDAQQGVISIVFSVARDEGLPLNTMDDLQAILTFVQENYKKITMDYGNVSPSSVGAIQRKLLTLTYDGTDTLFGSPTLNLNDFLLVDDSGRGQINLLAAERLMRSPTTYGVFLLWMLTELFELLPEAGDQSKPKLVFFFDEAHMLFKGASKLLLRTVERVVRLIRSKGVGVYFVSQSPADIPDDILGQLGNRIQHALRAFTARDQKAIQAAAQSFRNNPLFRTDHALTTMGIGEALTSFLDEKGSPRVVQRTLIKPPFSRIGPITDDERARLIAASPLYSKYTIPQHTTSARDILYRRGLKQQSRSHLIDSLEYLMRSRKQ